MMQVKEQGLGEGLRLGALLLTAAILLTMGVGTQQSSTENSPPKQNVPESRLQVRP